MAKIALQTDDEGLRARPGIIGGINTNSPLLLDDSQAEGLIEFARAGQPIHVTPFTLAGAMSPVTLAGALAQQNAEALAGLAFVAGFVVKAHDIPPTRILDKVDRKLGQLVFAKVGGAQSFETGLVQIDRTSATVSDGLELVARTDARPRSWRSSRKASDESATAA